MPLYNTEDFYITKSIKGKGDSHKKIDPLLSPNKYRNYWGEFVEKLIHGMWGYDYDRKSGNGGWRYCPNTLFTQVNASWAWIKNKYEVQEYRNLDCRDTDFFIHYGLMESFGFSGFEGDKYYTSFNEVYKIQNNIELNPVEKKRVEIFKQYLVTPTGKWKKWVEAKEYCYHTFKEPMGNPMYLNPCMNDIMFASRRVGKSETYKSVSKQQLITNCAKDLESYYLKNSRANIVLGSYGNKFTRDQCKRIWDSYEMLSTLGDHSYKEVTNKGAVIRRIEGALWHPFIGGDDLGDTKTNLVPARGGKQKVGAGSNLLRVTLNNNKSAMVGDDPTFVNGTEIGTWKDIVTPHGVTNPATEKDGFKFAPIAYDGTGGEMHNAVNAMEVFLNPKSIGAVSYPDYYGHSNDRTGRFLPCTFIGSGLRDDVGNLLLDESWSHEMTRREEEKKKGMKAFVLHITQYPMRPADMFMQASTTTFPVERASERLSTLQTRDITERDGVLIGDIDVIDFKTQKVKFRIDNSLQPITKAKMKKELPQHMHIGAYVLYEPPILDPEGNALEGDRCLATYDSIEHADGTSFCVVSVFKFTTERKDRKFFTIVAEKIYRIYGENSQNKNDKEALKLAALYGCKLGPETNKPNIINYAPTIGWYDMLEDCPIDAKKNIIPGAKQKYDVGVYISPKMTPGLITLAAEILMTVVDEKEILGLNGEKEVVDVWMVDMIDSEYLLHDIIFYKMGGNYDYMSCFFVICLYIKQRMMDGSLEKGQGAGNDLYQRYMEAITENIEEQNDAFSF